MVRCKNLRRAPKSRKFSKQCEPPKESEPASNNKRKQPVGDVDDQIMLPASPKSKSKKISKQSGPSTNKKGKQRVEDVDVQLTIPANARERYQKMKNRNPIPERGFDITSEEYGAISEKIQKRNWTTFCADPEIGNVSMLREFYTMAKIGTNPCVRGRIVHYAAEDINNFFNLPSLSSFSWEDLLNATDPSKIVEYLCVDGATWSANKSDPHNELDRKELNSEARAWMYFVCCRLMPTTSLSKVKFSRCALVYHIMKGTELDIGKIIAEQIANCVDSTTCGLFFPVLITKLCLAAGVKGRDGDEVIVAPRAINDRIISKYIFEKAPTEPRPQITHLPKRVSGADLGEALQQIQYNQTLIRHEQDEMKKELSWIRKLLLLIASATNCDLTKLKEPVRQPPPPRAATLSGPSRPSTSRAATSSGSSGDSRANGEPGDDDDASGSNAESSGESGDEDDASGSNEEESGESGDDNDASGSNAEDEETEDMD